MTAPRDPRVVVAIDIDGVLRLPDVSWNRSIWPDLRRAELTAHRDAFPHIHHAQPPWDEDGTWTVSNDYSGIGIDWIRKLSVDPRVELWWATTWAEHANTYIPPLLGIPDLPVATTSGTLEYRAPADWKAHQLLDRFAGRTLLWVDDDPLSPTVFEWARRPWDRAITRIQPIVGVLGITEADVEAMDAWIDLVTTVEGRRLLRERRRKRRSTERSWRRRHQTRP